MSVWVIAGRQRNGKNLFSLDIMHQAHTAGRLLYCNFDLLPACPFADDAVRIGTPEYPIFHDPQFGVSRARRRPGLVRAFWDYVRDDSVVVVDEADMEFDCMEWGGFDADARIAAKEIGKRGIDLYLVCQKVENLYNRWCRQADGVIWCEWNWRSPPWWLRQARRLMGPRAIYMSSFRRFEFSSIEMKPRHFRRGASIPYHELEARYFRAPWYDTRARRGDELRRQRAAAVDLRGVPSGLRKSADDDQEDEQ